MSKIAAPPPPKQLQQLQHVSIHHHFIERELAYIYFQAFRKTYTAHRTSLSNRLDNVLSFLKNKLNEYPHEYAIYLKYFYKLMGHIRADKGEHDLTYMMIYIWHRYFPTLTLNFIQQLVLNEGHEIQLGCWRDMKHLCEFVYRRDNTCDHPIIKMCILLMNEQLAKDLDAYDAAAANASTATATTATTTLKISNVAKWIPREHKSFDWLYTELVIHWFSRKNPFDDTYSFPVDNISFNKYKKAYRTKIAMLNKLLDTTQIKQCSQDYSNINPKNVNKLTYTNHPSLMYADATATATNTYTTTTTTEADIKKREQNRELCREYATTILLEKRARTESIKDDKLIRQKGRPVIYDTNIPISYYIKEAFVLLKLLKENNSHVDTETTHRIRVLNSKWESLSQNFIYPSASNKYIIPLLDTSYTMQNEDEESYYTAIGIAILLSHISLFSKRIICMDHLPTWLNIENENTLIEIVRAFDDATKSSRFTFPNIMAAVDLLVYSIQQTQLDKDVVKQLQIVILSDFSELRNETCDDLLLNPDEVPHPHPQPHPSSIHHHHHPSSTDCSLLYNKIQHKYTGIENIHTIPTIPTIVFWNLSKQAFVDLPCSIYQENALLLSGFSALQIKNIVNYKNTHPYNAICSILQNNKYNVLDKYVDAYMQLDTTIMRI